MNKLGFIGGGKMASAILNGVIKSKWLSSENIYVSDKNEDALAILKSKHNINITTDNAEVVKNCNIILFAVKPFVIREIMEEVKAYITQNHLVLSIAAGISTKTIEETIGDVAVVRIMPNTPALVNAGMSAICGGKNAKKEHKQLALEIFKNVGEVIETEEKYIDIITAISGSGPAFYYYIIDEIAKAGKKLGMDYDTCLKLSAQTALGSAKMIMQSGISPEQLIVNVTTPGGCTAVGNEVLKDNKVSDIMYETIEKTAKKAFELGKK
ncbi:pyrroline-5-carboxylate reductase [bacterium]|nr:pyrroline-5-carboxylate reductase [bacterium]